jgi:putative aldouronate transport system permease protein
VLGIFKSLMKNKAFLLLVLPGAAWVIIFAYLPMFGTKRFKE